MDWRPCALLLGCAYQFPGKHTTHYNLWQWRGSDTCCNKNKFSQQQMFGFSRFSVIFCLLLEILIHSASIAMAPQISVTDWSQISSFPRSTPAPPRADPVTGREPWRGARRWDGEMMGNYALISRWFDDIAWQCMTMHDILSLPAETNPWKILRSARHLTIRLGWILKWENVGD